MWSSYSARAAAQLIGLPESAVRGLIRDGLIGSARDVPAKLSFRDLAALRVVKGLVDAGIPMPRARRELVVIARGLPSGTSIAELPLEARAGRIHLRGAASPTAGQLELPLIAAIADATPEPAGEVHEMPARRDVDAVPVAAPPITADEWYGRAIALEDSDPVSAIDAYRRSLRLRPDSTEAWVNLGRLFAECGDPESASECFRSALDLDPTDATAVYNLGVVAQDTGHETDAIGLYTRALELDPAMAEAHYNLATLYDHGGDSRAAIRHINEYRKLTR
jgi:tetratricopeptide (TPR) repeat protein